MNSICRATLLGLVLACASGVPAIAARPAIDAALPTETVPACSWDRPGHNPFMGDVVAAIDRYRDMAPELRARLKARMAKRDYDDIVSIRRDSITGRAKYGSTISDMHFGTHQVCRSVTRAAWAPDMQERGLVYCEGRECILVPTVCRNVSRIARAAVANERAEAPDDEPAAVAAVPDVGFADPAPAETMSMPLALDNAPSFVAPDDWQRAVGGAGPGGFGPGGDAAWPGPGGGPTVGAAAVPPFGSDSPGSVGVPPLGAAPLPAGDVPAVPEPQTWALMLGGLAALLIARRRRGVKTS